MKLQREKIFGYGSRPPPFSSLLSKFLVPPPNSDDIFLHPPIPGQNFMSPPHSWTKCVVPPIFVQSWLPPPQIKGTPPLGVFLAPSLMPQVKTSWV